MTIVWIHNLVQWFKIDGTQKVRCKHCKHIDIKAKDWDYQRCHNCGEYHYDNRD